MISKKLLDIRLTDLEGAMQILEQRIEKLEAKPEKTVKPAKKAAKKNAK